MWQGSQEKETDPVAEIQRFLGTPAVVQSPDTTNNPQIILQCSQRGTLWALF